MPRFPSPPLRPNEVTHPTKISETCQDFIVDETGLSWISQGLVQDVVNEIDARLHGQHHAFEKGTGGSQTPETRQVNAINSLGKGTGA